MKNRLYTLNVGNYAPEICRITYPLLERYAEKCRASFHVLDKAPSDLAISGKFQLRELAREHDGWTIYLDSDALVHPDAFDYTACLDRKDKHGRPSVFSYGRDFAYERFSPDEFLSAIDESLALEFPQTAREAIGMCTWFIAVTADSANLWKSPAYPRLARPRIRPTVQERHLKTSESLLDDYQTSVNAATFNYSVTTAADIHKLLGETPVGGKHSFWHTHLLTTEQKARQMRWMIDHVWRLNDTPADVYERQEREFRRFQRKTSNEHGIIYRARRRIAQWIDC